MTLTTPQTPTCHPAPRTRAGRRDHQHGGGAGRRTRRAGARRRPGLGTAAPRVGGAPGAGGQPAGRGAGEPAGGARHAGGPRGRLPRRTAVWLPARAGAMPSGRGRSASSPGAVARAGLPAQLRPRRPVQYLATPPPATPPTTPHSPPSPAAPAAGRGAGGALRARLRAARVVRGAGGALAASSFHGGALHCRLLSLQGGACIAATSCACSARGLLTSGRRSAGLGAGCLQLQPGQPARPGSAYSCAPLHPAALH
jgi:hypothetical protein